MQFSNIHTHSNFSDGKNSIEEMVKGAIERNFVSYGISDHSETLCDLSYCMRKSQYEEYFAEINRLKEKYKDKIDVLCGIELDYFSDGDREKYDYIISSVHYMIENGTVYAIDHAEQIQRDCINNCYGGDQNKFAESYYKLCVENVKKNRPDIMRGQLSSAFYDEPFHQKLAGALLFNFLSRPDFVAYEYKYENNFFRRLVTFFGAFPVAWTYTEMSQIEKTRKSFKTFIFEKFIP